MQAIVCGEKSLNFYALARSCVVSSVFEATNAYPIKITKTPFFRSEHPQTAKVLIINMFFQFRFKCLISGLSMDGVPIFRPFSWPSTYST
ncbi:MAG: hypothetical protein CMM16_05755 [Rhodospirillaceae bacterium]|nr:hypothetical protein [Rhodospirillaceae bacterium]|tara:strand:- start:278 stop:547 length:270 start_codon:yes stop_codon:yes gene_type:complete